MKEKNYGYIRVSTKDQNEDRQLIGLSEYKILKKIFTSTNNPEKILKDRLTKSF